MIKQKQTAREEKELKDFHSDLKTMTPLMQLAGDGKIKELTELCKHTSVIDELSANQKWTPLNWAIFTGQEKCVRVLLKAGANPNHRDKAGSTVLMHAVLSGGESAVGISKALLSSGADPNAIDKKGASALMQAAASGNLPLVKLLLRSGADIHAADKDGFSAADYSEYGDNDNMYDFLMKYWAEH